ncbi:hypothetical protein PR001_g7366 [Phytophthora rubi]|uniref:Integrase catalytic domain-containing protein n=1 Tax=Phytophthora rubi TaxID=129364 RepID=A0A6A3N8K6_9STRA|nr:hypothetical protein PR001_g7366 [Phytophthora rubi]
MRKASPREIVPPLRSIKGVDVDDRWALDVAGSLPTSDGGPRYVIAALEYVTRYAVAVTVKQHTAENVAKFLMKQVMLKFVEPAQYGNFLVEREDVSGDSERYIGHMSFLVTYHYPVVSLQRVAADIEKQLIYEDAAERWARSGGC